MTSSLETDTQRQRSRLCGSPSFTRPLRLKQTEHRFCPYDARLGNDRARPKISSSAVSDDSVELLSLLLKKVEIGKLPLHGTATLPLEVLVIIGRFLAGQNSYATLAALAVGNKLLKQELTPVLWETVILDGDKGWWQSGINKWELLWRIGVEERKNLMHTKYLVLETTWSLFPLLAFPNVVVLIYRRRSDYLFNTSLRASQPWSLYIRQPVSATTLADLLANAVCSQYSRIRQSIRSLWLVELVENGCVLGKEQGRHMLPLGNGCPVLAIEFVRCESSISASSRAENTLRQLSLLLRCSAQAGHLAWNIPCDCEFRGEHLHGSWGTALQIIHIALTNGSERSLKVCLEGVSLGYSVDHSRFTHNLSQHPHSKLTMAITSFKNLEVSIHVLGSSATEAEMGELMHAAASYYQKLWPIIKSKPKFFSWRYMRCTFFRLTLSTSDPENLVTGALEGILSPDITEADSFWSVKYKRFESVFVEELSPARKYGVSSGPGQSQ
ncbi:hypothetical protein NliqN6_0890 [Naganishia liquefaciens]|uniref:Uncharacterized protein n=1 Tax=Naganishia liquefaciens TaxID=104408 RepID=A0A8H3YCS6_9TREE|nr:hypothetical protein NliqN6_0890 [Naganishia liquefaciens]